MTKKPVFVTGAAGFIAFHLIERLLRSGVAVVGIDNFDPFYDERLKAANVSDLREIAEARGVPFEFRRTDVRDLSVRDWGACGFGTMVHLAAKAGVRPSLADPAAYVQTNCGGTLRVLEFCREAGIKRLVFGSSSSVYGDDTPAPFKETAACARPLSPYAATKRAGELLCASYAGLFGMSVAALRFFTVYGPRQRPDLAIHKFCRLMSEGASIPFFGDGTTSRDYTHVSDVVDGVVASLDWTARQPSGVFEVFNVGGSKTTSLATLVEILERCMGVRARLEKLDAQPGDVTRTFADVSKARAAFGYEPKIGMADGLREFVEWFKSSLIARGTRVA